jgi:hypothetical protein
MGHKSSRTKHRIMVGQEDGQVTVAFYVNNREVEHAVGATEEEARLWLLRRLSRLLRRAEEICIEERKLTEEQIDEALLQDRGSD